MAQHFSANSLAMTVNQSRPNNPDAATDYASMGKVDRSFEDVFRDEHLKMLRLATLLLGSQSLAEEAVQDVFAKLLDRFGSVRNPGGFLRTATINRCRDIQRRGSRDRRLLRRLRPVKADTHLEVPLDDVLAGISQQRREILVLRYYVGHTTPEIAKILGIPEGTVRSATHRALAELKEVLI